MKFPSIAILFLLALGSCSSSGQKDEACCSGPKDAGKAVVMQLEQSNLNSILKKDSIILIDVRTPEEVAEGYIAEADSFIDYQSPDFESKISKLNKDYTYVMYCRSGGRSGKASDFMVENGFKRVYNLKGGVLEYPGSLKQP